MIRVSRGWLRWSWCRAVRRGRRRRGRDSSSRRRFRLVQARARAASPPRQSFITTLQLPLCLLLSNKGPHTTHNRHTQVVSRFRFRRACPINRAPLLRSDPRFVSEARPEAPTGRTATTLRARRSGVRVCSITGRVSSLGRTAQKKRACSVEGPRLPPPLRLPLINNTWPPPPPPMATVSTRPLRPCARAWRRRA